jgi:hypothetical protein
MTKWEYWVTSIEKNDLQRTLTEAGRACWELIYCNPASSGSTYYDLIFKRELT